jgi:ABC-type amino acid transport substrate-binding protein
MWMIWIHHLTSAQQPMRIGVNHNPPYISIHTTATDTTYTGIVIDILTRSTTQPYELIYCSSKEDAIHKLGDNQIDLVANASINFDRLSRFNATTPYMHSEVGVCMKKPLSMSGIDLIWYNIKQQKWNILKIFGCFYVAFVLLGSLFYFLDHFDEIFLKRSENFNFKLCFGWWYFVFVACFEGFEDKTKTSLSRLILMNVIMALQLIIIPLITGMMFVEIQKNNDDQNHIASIGDLKNYNIITIKGTSNESLLQQNGIAYKTVTNIDSALVQCTTGKYILVHDKAIINWYVYQNNMKDNLIVSPFTIQINDRVFLYHKGEKNKIIQDLNLNPLKLRDSRELDWMMSKYNN